MSDLLRKPVLLTGASGNLGRHLAKTLGALGWTLRLTDMAAFPDELPPGATFRRVDLADGVEVMRLVEGCGLVLHFGGASTDEWSFKGIEAANLTGLYHVYEGARLTRARVVFASSNHAIGFHPRSERLDSDCSLLPDSLYGASKAFGEGVAGLYWHKHRVESVLVRIGSCFPEPIDERMLSTWLSYADLARLMVASAQAETVGCKVIWGASNNSRSFWGKDDRAALGWAPQDSADVYANKVMGKVSDNPVAERFQGGAYAGRG